MTGSIKTLRGILAGTCIALLALPALAGLSLEQAIRQAQDQDPWLSGNQLRQEALVARSIAAGELPDPVVNVGLANLPTDTFDFNQEAMTQVRVGVSQQLPRGDSRALRRQQLEQLGSQYPLQRADRRAQLAVTVTRLWLELYRQQERVRLVQQDRSLFEQLVDVARSRYATVLGRASQQDLIRAQLELTRLDDRLTRWRQEQATASARLAEWLPGAAATAHLQLPAAAPSLTVVASSGDAGRRDSSRQVLMAHPAVLELDRRIAAGDTAVSVAEQEYRPQWAFSASYGYREHDPQGVERSDFFSLGVTVDLPWFTDRRQDQGVRAARAESAALRTERALLLRNLDAQLASAAAELQGLAERRALYRERLLAQMDEQAQAALTAYTHDDGDFAEVARARIAQLNARIEALDIEVDYLQAVARFNYFHASAVPGQREAGS